MAILLTRIKYRAVLKFFTIGCALALALISTGRGRSMIAQNQCPDNPPVDITSPQVPADVCVPDGFSGVPTKFFDDYSWRAFIALVWPAQPGQRGMPDLSQTVGSPGPRVFQTYKSAWEIFHNDGSAPVEWNVYEDKKFNACGQALDFGGVVLASFSKFGDIGQADFGSLVGPLVAQNNTYVRYLTGFNKVEFDKISSENLFKRENLGTDTKPLSFPVGALDVKSAWVVMDGISHPERFYQTHSLVFDPQLNQCVEKTVGLVGLHIVQKTPTRPQWIWSSFEQIDNIPQPGASAPFTFNDGSGTPMPMRNLISFPPPPSPPTKFNVQRLTDIAPSTKNTNALYQAALRQQGAVWQFYQLVMTQWPVPPNTPTNEGLPLHTTPPQGSATAFANVTMETFDQTRISRGCMACHDSTRKESDFLWSLNDHAFPAVDPNFLLKAMAFRKLTALLRMPEERLATPQPRAPTRVRRRR